MSVVMMGSDSFMPNWSEVMDRHISSVVVKVVQSSKYINNLIRLELEEETPDGFPPPTTSSFHGASGHRQSLMTLGVMKKYEKFSEI